MIALSFCFCLFFSRLLHHATFSSSFIRNQNKTHSQIIRFFLIFFVFMFFAVEVKVDDRPVQVTLCDTAGQDYLDPLRRLCYPDSDVFLLCFSVIKPDTFVAVREKWTPIFRKTRTPIVLVGTQSDLRNDSAVISQLLVR